MGGSNQHTAGWSEQNIALLRRMWGAGFSAGAVAKALGITKDAAIGKVRRIGLGNRSTTVALPNPTSGRPAALEHWRQPRMTMPKIPSRAEAIREPKFAKVSSLPASCEEVGTVKFMDLGPRMCRWPSSGEARDGDLMFCGAETEAGAKYPYCPEPPRPRGVAESAGAAGEAARMKEKTS